ncbi:MAG: endonuclease/exonuclease/phosphatase family protein [Alphaproteobacteria bacterium]|nr:endonuclease/exonuclease/phosphatase family protein [Alphaproteobacteria bacterium]
MHTLLLSVPVALLALHHLVDDSTAVSAALHALSGWLFVPASVLAVVVALRAPQRGWPSALLAVAVLLPALRGHGPHIAPEGEPLRVVTANVLMVNDAYDDVLAELVAADPDVIVLQEVSHGWGAALAGPVLDDWPYRRVIPQEGSFGIAVLSRVPARFETVDLLGVPAVRAVLDDGTTVLGVHTLPPRNAEYAPLWHAQMGLLAELDADVVAGDLNATRHHPSYRRLLATGMRDAHAEVGRASASTWPNGVFPVPPMRLDHVLVGPGLGVVGVRELPAHGSDHAPVVADLVVRRHST